MNGPSALRVKRRGRTVRSFKASKNEAGGSAAKARIPVQVTLASVPRSTEETETEERELTVQSNGFSQWHSTIGAASGGAQSSMAFEENHRAEEAQTCAGGTHGGVNGQWSS